MKRFKYDTVKLIEAVRDRPCLWNKQIENYKDRVERRLAWVEIFNILDERYEALSSDEKRLTSEMVLSKWTNIRDTFVKSLRKKTGKPKKQYVLYEHLKFLTQIIPETEQEQQEQDNLGYITEQPLFLKDEIQKDTSFNEETVEDYEISYEDTNDSSEPDAPVHKESSSKRKRSKKETHKEDSNMDFVSIDDPRIMNEDEAFFASLLPTVVKYDEDERLEFRIEVLALMKRIKDKRKWSPNS